jgi:hypothetical protein
MNGAVLSQHLNLPTLLRIVSRYIFLFFAIVMCGGFWQCSSQKYVLIPPDAVNETIRFDVTIQGPAELMHVVYPYPDSHNVHIDWKQKRNSNSYKIILTHTKLEDDSIEAFKYIVQAQYNGTTWNIISILRTHKCHEGRANTKWNTELCK